MKRALLSILSICLVATLSTPTAGAAVKPGAACKKLGATSTVSGIRYDCVKSGKRLIWNKASSSKKTPSQSSTSAQSSQNIATDAISIPMGITYRYINGRLERESGYPEKFFSSDSRKPTDFDPIRVKAYEAIRSRMNNAPHPNLIFDWDIKPGFPSELASYSKDKVAVAASYWGWVFKDKLTIPSQLVTELDLEWAKQQELKFSDTVNILEQFQREDFKRQRHWMGGGAHFWRNPFNPSDSRLYTLLNFQAPSYATTKTLDSKWVMVPAHEVMHIVQDYYRKGMADVDNTIFNRRTHATFEEGSANLFGYALSLDHLGWYSDGLDEFLYGTFKNDPYWKPIKTNSDVIKVLLEAEARTNRSTRDASYAVGAMLYEWVITKYGFDSYLKILENLAKYDDYSETLKAALGITKSELYAGAAPYILAAFERLKIY
jgi:hypothetical protein